MVFSKSKQCFTLLVPAFALCSLGHVAGELLGWLVVTLQPFLEQGRSSEVSQVLFNALLKFNALDNYALRAAPGHIINLILSQQGCTFNKVHLLPPVLPSQLSWMCPLLHSPYNSNWRLPKEHKRSRVSIVGRSSGSVINHISNISQLFVPAPTVLGISTLLSCNTSQENCLCGCASLAPGSEGPPVMICGVLVWSFRQK